MRNDSKRFVTLKNEAKVEIKAIQPVQVIGLDGQWVSREIYKTKSGWVYAGVPHSSFELCMTTVKAEAVKENLRYHAVVRPPVSLPFAYADIRRGWRAEQAAAVVGGHAPEYAVHQGWCTGCETLIVGFVPDMFGNPRRYVTGKEWLLGISCVLINLP